MVLVAGSLRLLLLLLHTYAAAEEGDAGVPSAGGGLVLRGLLREEEPFLLLARAGQALVALGRGAEARELLGAAMEVCGRRWGAKWKRDTLKLLLFEAALREGPRECATAMQGLRQAAARWPHSPVVWNAYCRYLTGAGSFRAALKFLQPLRARHPVSLPLMLVLGHCHLANGQVPQALSEYMHAYRWGGRGVVGVGPRFHAVEGLFVCR